jgi:hypothetical protein
VKTCPKCGLEKELGNFSVDRKKKDGRYAICKSCHAEVSALYRIRIRKIVFDHYGNSCACCGQTEPAFLGIDHINNDGNSIRWPGGKRLTSRDLYVWIIRNDFPSDLQILCHNCNLGRHINGGQCPHATTRVNPRRVFSS